MKRGLVALVLGLMVAGCAPQMQPQPALQENQTRKVVGEWDLPAPDQTNKLYIEPWPENTSNYLYQTITGLGGVEYTACMYGGQAQDTTVVKQLVIPMITHYNQTRVRYYPCPDKLGDMDYKGMLHSHPTGNCNPSLIDMDRFMRDERAVVEAIHCGVLMAYNRTNIETFLEENKEIIEEIRNGKGNND